MGSPQTAYSLNNKAGIAGQFYDNDESNFVDSKPCGAVALAAGTVVELVAGVLQIAQGTGDPNSKVAWGVVLFSDSMEPNPTTGAGAYLPGMDVPVVRRGRVWALLDAGVAVSIGAAANYTHSSDASHGQGTFTNAGVSAVVGQEVSATKAIWFADGGLVGATPSLACVELNLP